MGFRNSIFSLVKNGIRTGVRTRLGEALSKTAWGPRVRPHIRRWLTTRFHPGIAEVQGHRMYLDRQDRQMLSWYGCYEPGVTELFYREIKAGQTVLDIGAYIGYFTLLAARQVGPKGRVIAFEPAPENRALLERNLETHGYSQVQTVPLAVADQVGETTLYLSNVNEGDHRLAPDDSSQRVPEHTARLKVGVTSIDQFLKNDPGPVHFIKMDIQGAEGMALNGMSELLRRQTDIKLVTEFWPPGLRASDTDPSAYLETLAGYGFRIFCLRPNLPSRETTDLAALLRLAETTDDINLYCVRG